MEISSQTNQMLFWSFVPHTSTQNRDDHVCKSKFYATNIKSYSWLWISYHVISNTTQYMCTSKVLVMKSCPDQDHEAVLDFSQNLNTVLLSCDWKREQKWNAFKMCLCMTLMVTNLKSNFMVYYNFINDWNLDLGIKMLHEPEVWTPMFKH